MSSGGIVQNNVDVLNVLKEQLMENVANDTYTFNVRDPIDGDLRCPNLREQKEYLLDILRGIRMRPDMRSKINTDRYRSIKGEIKKGHFTNVCNFFDNIGFTSVKSDLEKYAKSKTIYEARIEVILPQPVQLCTIDIDINKGGD